nr:acyltransferase [Acidobacteriota bacterium]
PKRFLLRRGLKIYPAFYVFLLVSILVKFVFSVEIPVRTVLSETFFLQNYVPGMWAHTWSLAVEEHFYLLLIISLFLAQKQKRDDKRAFWLLPHITILMSILILSARIATSYYIRPNELLIHNFPTHLRLDSLLFGIFLSYYDHFHHSFFVAFIARKTWQILTLSCLFISTCLFFDQQSFFMSTIGLTLLYLGFGGLVAISLYGNLLIPKIVSKLLTPIASVLARLGFYSYSIYLWHVIIATWGILFIRRLLHLTIGKRLEFLLYAAASIICGIIMAKFIEQPVLRLRNRYFPARGEAVEISSVSSATAVAVVSSTYDLPANV